MEQHFDSKLTDIRSPIEDTAGIAGVLGISADDLVDPVTYNRFREVVEYFAGKEDSRYIMNKTLAGKNVNKLDHLFGYVTLRKEHANTLASLQKLESEISFYER